ncbi:MAG: hypothetical protein HZC22_12325 [Rhodocyclales bacterium]|nr:hypothetical protein [Rhodocyclales bacterium]
MNFRETQSQQTPPDERRGAFREEGSGWGTPIPPSADVEYANRLGVEYFSLKPDCGQGVLRPRSDQDKARPR